MTVVAHATCALSCAFVPCLMHLNDHVDRPVLRFLLISLLAFLSTAVGSAQDAGVDKKTVFGNMSVDETGHVCYIEPIGRGPLDRLEFRTDGKDVLFLYLTANESSKQVEVTDLDRDGRPDLIHIEWVSPKGITTQASYYRGPEYREHLRHHLLHALAATRRHLIKDKPEEQQRATMIEARLKQMEARTIAPSEIGVYRDKPSFTPSDHKDLRYAFIASDTLTAALRSLVDGDVRILSRTPEIVPTYRIDIDLLLAIDPSLTRLR